MKKTGWIIGTVAFSSVFVLFSLLLVVKLSTENVAVTMLPNGDIAAGSPEGVAIRISEFEGLSEADVSIKKTTVPELEYDASVTAYDFSVSGKQSFDTLLEVRVMYDASVVLPMQDPSDCIVAGYYNEETGKLEPVIYDIDEENSQVIITTNHLSTYMAIAFPDNQTRNAQCPLPGPTRLSDVLPGSAMESYQNVLTKLQSGTEVSEFDAFEVGFNSMVTDLGIYGGVTAVLHEAVYTNDYIAKLNDGFTNTGIAFIFAQLALDTIKGDVGQLNTNLMKNLTNYGGALINPLVGAASFTFDYTLGKLGTLKTDLDKKYYDEYEEFYKKYEREQKKTNGSFSKRMFQSLYRIYNEYEKSGEKMTPEIMQSTVTKLVSDYCGIIWKQDMAGTFSDYAEHGMTNALQKQITDTAYNNIMKNYMPAVFAALQKRVVYDAKIKAINGAAALDKELNTLCTLNIRETQNFIDGEYNYANCIVQFDANVNVIDDWTFRLDENGRASAFFLVLDYLNAKIPTTANIYASELDMAAGRAMETLLFSFDSQNHSIDINLGASEEFRIETSNTQIHVGESVIFSIKPYADGYTCKWNVTDETTGYINVLFSEAGLHNVIADVYDAQGIQVAALSVDVLVEAVDLRIEASSSSPKAKEAITLEVASDTIATSTLYTEWYFGDGNLDAGYYNLYDYWYEQSGDYTVTVNAYKYTDSGDKIFVCSAQTVVSVGEEEQIAEITPVQNTDPMIALPETHEEYTFVLSEVVQTPFTSPDGKTTYNMTETSMNFSNDFESEGSAYRTECIITWDDFPDRLVCGETYLFGASGAIQSSKPGQVQGLGMWFEGYLGERNGYITMLESTGHQDYISYGLFLVETGKAPKGKAKYEIRIPNADQLGNFDTFTIVARVNYVNAEVRFRYKLEKES